MRLMKAEEVARMAGVSTRTVWGWGRAKKVPVVRVGRTMLFPEHKIMEQFFGEPAAPGDTDVP